MKCEKCGVEILEGNICEKCKGSVLDNVDTNLNIINENIQKNETGMSLETTEKIMGNGDNQNVNYLNNSVPNKKGTDTVVYVIISFAVISLIMFLFNLIQNFMTVNDMHDDSRVHAFVTEVQKYMDIAKTSFIQIALDKPATDIIFTSDNTDDGSKLIFDDYENESDKLYYIKMNRHAMFVKLVIYDDSFCYEADIDTDDDVVEDEFEKSDVHSYDVHIRNDNDSFHGCTGEKIQ